MDKLKVNDRVEILRTDISCLKHRKRPWVGKIVEIDGEYIYVRPNHVKYRLELYRCEVRKCERQV